MSGDLFYSGKAVRIRFARTERGALPAKEFLDAALSGKRRDRSARSLVAKMQRLADHGPTNNEHHYKHLEGELYEFKAGQLRLLCAWEGGELVLLLNGFKKKQQGTRRQELERAQRILSEHRANSEREEE